MNLLFLTIGEKIRQARKQFNLKQGSFHHFGITQHYLSMIETNKRQVPNQTLRDIYEAFMELTDGQIQSVYTFEEFCLPIEQQVSQWLEQQLNLNVLPRNYEELMSISEKYLLSQYAISIDEQMGEYYFKNQDYQMMTYYYRRAIASSIKFKINPAPMYIKFARYLRKIGKYEDAIFNLCLAQSTAKELEDKSILYEAQIFLGLTYIRMNEFHLAHELADELLMYQSDLKGGRFVGAWMIKELSIRGLEGPEASRKYLYQLLESDARYDHPVLVHFIYRNLGWNYIESKQYKEALDALNKCLPMAPDELEKALISILIGHIYCQLNIYDKAQECFSISKQSIFESKSLRRKKLWLNEQISLYCILNEKEKIKELFNELNDLVVDGKFSKATLYELKTITYKKFKEKAVAPEDNFQVFYDFFVS